MSFTGLHARLCDALRAGRPRLVAETLQADGSWRLLFEDGAVVDVVGRRGRENGGGALSTDAVRKVISSAAYS